jgi:hypothetical protein
MADRNGAISADSDGLQAESLEIVDYWDPEAARESSLLLRFSRSRSP